ncbi:MAG: hypothetical protein IGBAC_0102 [Ignavibacteriae bacterium]|nr:MAG: hypothetical protein IGBAC_0102 [Ignavibacteriota bacterium]
MSRLFLKYKDIMLLFAFYIKIKEIRNEKYVKLMKMLKI